MNRQQSLALALTYVAQALGVPSDREAMQSTPEGANPLSGTEIADTGVYGTYPTSTPSIVKFDNGLYYYVKDPANHQIIDTDYNVVDMALYGTPTGWATYQLPSPQAMVYVTADISGIHYERLKTAPQKMYVRRIEGIDLIDFSGTIKTPREFSGIPDTHLGYGQELRIMGTASYPVPGYPDEQFYIPQDPVNVWGEFTRTGKPAQLAGYRVSDLQSTKPPAPVKVSRPVITEVTRPAVKPPAVRQPSDYHFQWLRTDREPVRYQVMYPITIPDAGKYGPPITIIRGKTIKLLGTFVDHGHTVFLPMLDNPAIPLFKYWYGIPEVVQGKRIVEELPDFSEIRQISTTVPEREALDTASFTDHVVYWATKFEVGLERGFAKLKIIKGK